MFGVLLIIALYHFILFAQQREERASLEFFGLMVSVNGFSRVFAMAVATEIGIAESSSFYEVLFCEYLAMPVDDLSLAFVRELLPAGWLRFAFKFWGLASGYRLSYLLFILPKAVFGGWLIYYQVHLLGTVVAVFGAPTIESFRGSWIARWCLWRVW